MKSLTLKAIKHKKHVCKKKVNIEQILDEIKRSSVTNLDKDTM